MSIEPAVAERLARQLDQPRLAVFPHERQIVGERIAVPHVSFFHQQGDGLVALRAGAPTDRPLSGSAQEHVRGAPDAILFLLPGQLAGNFMMVAMPRSRVILSARLCEKSVGTLRLAQGERISSRYRKK
ncbi:MAG TPA: hypothetical protein VFS81_14215 [Candidatus Binatia bacterium]|nr:hypothetical protein [Candidatus Binatia bacterium]